MRFITVFLRFIQSNSVYLCCFASLQNILYAHSNRNTTSANILSLFKRKSRHRTVVLKKHPLRTPAVAIKIINGNNIVDPCTFPLITSQDKVLSKRTDNRKKDASMRRCWIYQCFLNWAARGYASLYAVDVRSARRSSEHIFDAERIWPFFGSPSGIKFTVQEILDA